MEAKTVLLALGEGIERERPAAELSRLGYEVVSSTTAGETLRQVRERSPDLIVIDRRLPGGGWISTLRRALKERPALRAILASRQPLFDGGFELWMADDGIRLPLVAEDLAKKARRLVGDPPARRSLRAAPPPGRSDPPSHAGSGFAFAREDPSTAPLGAKKRG